MFATPSTATLSSAFQAFKRATQACAIIRLSVVSINARETSLSITIACLTRAEAPRAPWQAERTRVASDTDCAVYSISR